MRRLEAIMKSSCFAVVALLSLSSAAWAQSSVSPGSVSREDIARAASMSMSLYPASHYARNANNCAPEQSRAVWGRNQVLLGYACYTNPNGL
jgi:hypothetical protein